MSRSRRLLVLGAGRLQVPLIRRAVERGIEVVASDYYPDAPGKRFATFATMASSTDLGANLAVAREYEVDGVATTGTDMPVATMAGVAAALGLPCYLTPRTGRIATDKVVQSAAIASNGGRRPGSAEITPDGDVAAAVSGLRPPLILKPADSQGQRGITRVDDLDPEALETAAAVARASSRTGRAIAEEFVDGHEIAASGWVSRGETRVIMISDRVTYNRPPALGVAIWHLHPAGLPAQVVEDVERQVRATTAAFEMEEGPVYMQLMVVGDEAHIIEGGARAGGGHEPDLFPHLTGEDLYDRIIDLALEGAAEPVGHRFGDGTNPPHAGAGFLLARAGTIARTSGFEPPLPEGILAGGFYVGPGRELVGVENATSRVGYYFAAGDDRPSLLERAGAFAATLRLEDEAGSNLLFEPEPEFLRL